MALYGIQGGFHRSLEKVWKASHQIKQISAKEDHKPGKKAQRSQRSRISKRQADLTTTAIARAILKEG